METIKFCEECGKELPKLPQTEWQKEHNIVRYESYEVSWDDKHRCSECWEKLLNERFDPVNRVKEKKEELRTCPFCGSRAQFTDGTIVCTNPQCGGIFMFPIFDNYEWRRLMAQKFNRRTLKI